MGLLCNCPLGASITSVPVGGCPESFGQIQKVVFQRIFSTGTTKNKFVLASANPNVLASWTPLLAASDGTKVVQSPYLHNVVTEVGEATEYGGGNETVGGIPIITGRGPTTVTANILNASQKTIEALKDYQCENVGVSIIDEYGRIGLLVDDWDTPAEYYPIPLASVFVGDKSLGGFETPDINVLTWRFFPNWSDKLAIITPTDFNALTDLATP